ncbi:hypothetical protein SPSIL_036710 [Sporomusa silvacetica DSM 10669]|uniref:Carbohydrate diacid regulator n=1 Tax=Sporomusa silvacetica DSM 10669 TaxID=1123289 RepID=A0ABZ3IP15_9FIRM|nr:helix-turn-helix domain-containing protein [Sporomusa silvacetica]OZC19854.1 carbohydrate diacid transcriptional activator CdaR [Sporomusa silvacetica DSM 10669]
MTSTQNSVFLLEKVLEQGLPFVASYLTKEINRPVVIADGNGHIHYPQGSTTSLNWELFGAILPGINEDEYYYHEAKKCLVYQIGSNNTRAFVIVQKLCRNQMLETISVITDTRLAIKNYFINMDKVRISTEKFERKFAEHLFIKSNVNIRDIIKMHGIDLDIRQPYCVKLIEIDHTESESDLRLIIEDIIEYTKRRKLEIIQPLIWGKGVMFILPAVYKDDTLEVDLEWPRVIDSLIWKEAAEKKFNITLSIGLGQTYTIRDLHKSYHEARIALALPKLLGQIGVVQRFCDLGMFAQLFSQDVGVLKNQCLKILGVIIDYDNKIEAELFPTLRAVLDNSCNWKLSSESLFIHVNTLHYRVSKIEQLLDVNLSNMDTRANLYMAIKVWDTLKNLGFLDNIPGTNQKCRLSYERSPKGKKDSKAI